MSAARVAVGIVALIAVAALGTVDGEPWKGDRVPVKDYRATPAPAEPVDEDGPAWDCRTMGNRECGPGSLLPDGTQATVGTYRACPPATVPTRPGDLGECVPTA